MTISAYNFTGWHTETSRAKEMNSLEVTKYNVLRGFGYVPVIGIFTGLADINIGKDEKDLATRVYGIARGILEIIGLGILFLIPDAIVSIHRHFCAEAPHAKKV